MLGSRDVGMDDHWGRDRMDSAVDLAALMLRPRGRLAGGSDDVGATAVEEEEDEDEDEEGWGRLRVEEVMEVILFWRPAFSARRRWTSCSSSKIRASGERSVDEIDDGEAEGAPPVREGGS